MRLFHDADAGQRLVGKPGVLFMEEPSGCATAAVRDSAAEHDVAQNGHAIHQIELLEDHADFRPHGSDVAADHAPVLDEVLRDLDPPPSASPGMSPAIWRIRVDFPEPDEPMSATISPGLMCRLTRSSPFPPENVLLRVSMWIMLNSSLVVGRISGGAV